MRTHTTRKSSAALQRHELYMKLTSLEIERSRRATERQATLERVAMIEQRIASIETEQALVRSLLEKAGFVESSLPTVEAAVKPKSTIPPNRNGMQLKY
jgi:hypothetical protein